MGKPTKAAGKIYFLSKELARAAELQEGSTNCLVTKEDNLAAVVIMDGMTISQAGQNNNIVVIDGLLHGQLGADKC